MPSDRILALALGAAAALGIAFAPSDATMTTRIMSPGLLMAGIGVAALITDARRWICIPLLAGAWILAPIATPPMWTLVPAGLALSALAAALSTPRPPAWWALTIPPLLAAGIGTLAAPIHRLADATAPATMLALAIAALATSAAIRTLRTATAADQTMATKPREKPSQPSP